MSRLYVGEGPADEDTADITVKGYKARAGRECRAFIGQLRRLYGPEPPGATLVVAPTCHDAGSIYAVHCRYTTPEGEEYAVRLADGIPDRWDDQARNELELSTEDNDDGR